MRSIAADTSAVLAVLLAEPDRGTFEDALRDNDVLISAATRVEVALVARGRLGPDGPKEAAELLATYGVRVVSLDERQAQLALEAMDRYGKGRGAPPAVLNYGDLFSYALPKAENLPLLFKGQDFTATGVGPALV